MRYRIALFALIFAACLLAPRVAEAETAKEIDAHVDAALQRFVSQVKGGQELLGKANAVLVLPKVVKGGIVIGGEYGEGSLRVGARTIKYYSIASASIGLTFGGEVKDLIILFMDEQAYLEFRDSKGWEAGVDGNIAVIKVGGGASVDTAKLRESIIGFVVGVKGLIVDASFKGSKFTPIKR
jgi:lipid-binding SYLF domain-containing protein